MTGCAEALTDLPAPLPCLETLQAEVEVYAQTLASLNARQEGSKSTKGDKSDIVETARLVLCKKLRTVTAMLMIYYEDQPERIENYFALTLIRRTTQTTFEGTTAPQQTSFIAERTLQPDGDDVLLINAGPGELKFWMAEQKKPNGPAAQCRLRSQWRKQIRLPHRARRQR